MHIIFHKNAQDHKCLYPCVCEKTKLLNALGIKFTIFLPNIKLHVCVCYCKGHFFTNRVLGDY